MSVFLMASVCVNSDHASLHHAKYGEISGPFTFIICPFSWKVCQLKNKTKQNKPQKNPQKPKPGPTFNYIPFTSA